jgi:hypothetical protein
MQKDLDMEVENWEKLNLELEKLKEQKDSTG